MTVPLNYSVEQNLKLVSEVIPGPQSVRLNDYKSKYVADCVSYVNQIFAAKADGGILVDVDGNHIIDFVSGIGVTAVGASNPEIQKVIAEQAGLFSHTAFGVCGYEIYVQVAEKLARLFPGDGQKKAVLFNSGAEAVENAVKIARRATGKTSIIAFNQAFHGRTNLALSLTSKYQPYKIKFGPFAGGVHRVSASYPFRDAESISGEEQAQKTINEINNIVSLKDTAALIIEPIQGEGGVIVPAPGFLSPLADWAKANNILFIADEIQSGMNRTGKFLAIEHEDVVPDLVCLSKSLGGGLPLSAVVGRKELLDSVPPGGLGGTFAGNPVACAAALKSLELMEVWDLAAKAKEFETEFFRLTQPLLKLPTVGEIRGRGALLGIEFVQPNNKLPYGGIVNKIITKALRKGLFLLNAGESHQVIRICPALTMPIELFKQGVQILTETIVEVSKNKK